jgi:hypothetical protein
MAMAGYLGISQEGQEGIRQEEENQLKMACKISESIWVVIVGGLSSSTEIFLGGVKTHSFLMKYSVIHISVHNTFELDKLLHVKLNSAGGLKNAATSTPHIGPDSRA